MSNSINRRNLFQLSGAAVGSAFVGAAVPGSAQAPLTRPLRLGFVGVGDRGSYHLDIALGMDSIEVPAICDINPAVLHRAKSWIEETGIDDLYDYIVFDCPPATKIVSQNAIAASHGYIIPVVPEAVMERGAPHLHEMIRTGIDRSLKALAQLGDRRRVHIPDTQLVGVVVTRIQTAGGRSGYTNDHTQHLSSLKRQWGNQLIEPYIVQGTGVSQSLSDGVPVYDRDTTQNVGGRNLHNQFKDVTEELRRRIDVL